MHAKSVMSHAGPFSRQIPTQLRRFVVRTAFIPAASPAAASFTLMENLSEYIIYDIDVNFLPICEPLELIIVIEHP